MKLFKALFFAAFLLVAGCASRLSPEQAAVRIAEIVQNQDELKALDKIETLRMQHAELMNALMFLALAGVIDKPVLESIAEDFDSAPYLINKAYTLLLEGDKEQAEALVKLVESNFKRVTGVLKKSVEQAIQKGSI